MTKEKFFQNTEDRKAKMTKEEFFIHIEKWIRFSFHSKLACAYISCSKCPFFYKVYIQDYKCKFMANFGGEENDNNISDYRTKNILKEYEKYKAELLIEKLK